MDNFKDLRYFKHDSKIDRWNQPKQMSRKLLVKLDELRHAMGAPIYVTSGFRPAKPGRVSQHQFGKAVDVICPAYNLMDFYKEADSMDWPGLGVYPYWEFKHARVGGLHLDVRDLEPNEKLARWMGVASIEVIDGIENIKQRYIALTPENLKRFSLA